MTFPNRPIAFVLTASNHGSMIVNRNDYHSVAQAGVYGVGFQILSQSCFDQPEVNFALALLGFRLRHFGNGVVAVDGGANIGVHTIEWARYMHGWGSVMSFEAQEVVYYALAGNIALNNCLNVRARLAALGETCGEMAVPRPNYFQPASFGSLELRQRANTEFIGQFVSYDAATGNTVPVVNLDSLSFQRLDFIKLDVEGMEIDVLRGARHVLGDLHPCMLIEIIKSDREAIAHFLTGLGYHLFPAGLNVLAVHTSDPTLAQVVHKDNVTSLIA